MIKVRNVFLDLNEKSFNFFSSFFFFYYFVDFYYESINENELFAANFHDRKLRVCYEIDDNLLWR